MPQPKTGLVFRSVLGTPEMAERLERKFPRMAWQLGDSDQYRCYYLIGKRYDGVMVKVMPEDEADEYYLGVYFADMPEFPKPDEQLAIAQQIHAEVLLVVEGVTRP
jgi:IMP cyclohydrolase